MRTKSEAEYLRRLGERLRAAREAHGWSLYAVGVRANRRIGGEVVGSYERGDRAATPEMVARLAALYGVPVGSLVPGWVDGAEYPFTAVTRDALREVRHADTAERLATAEALLGAALEALAEARRAPAVDRLGVAS